MEIKERLNVYVCEYGCHNITVDVDKGVTPFMIDCQFTGRPDRPLNPLYAENGKCKGVAQSCMYPKQLPDGVPYPVPTHEWYRKLPDDPNDLYDPLKVKAYREAPLELRPRTKAEPLLHTN